MTFKPHPKIKPKQKGKRKSIKALDKALWEICSEYIRRRDAKKYESMGYAPDRCKCFTCDYVGHWKYDMEAGHFISRRHLATKFDERNLNSQCPGCNKFQSGNQYKHGRLIDKLYGPGTADMLALKAKSQCKWLPFEYEQKIDYYKQKLKEL